MTETPQTTTGFAPVDGGQLYYETAGAGPALVLVHGGLMDSRLWDAQVAAFAPYYRVIRYDVRGCGQSATPEAPFYHEHDLAALLRHLGGARAAVLGLSLGARIAVDFALAYPAQVTALLLAAPGLSGYEFVAPELKATEPALQAALQQGDRATAVDLTVRTWTVGPRRAPEQVEAAVRERMRRMLTANWAREWDRGLMRDPEPPAITRLEAIDAPTLVIVGDEDVSDILTIADLLTTRIPGARQVVLPNVAHIPNLEQPAAFNRLVLEFLGGVG